jgi:hypothetical protein
MKKIGRFILLIIGLNAGIWGVVLAGYHHSHPEDIMIQDDANAKDKTALAETIEQQMDAMSQKMSSLYDSMKSLAADKQEVAKKQIQSIDAKRADLKGELSELRSGLTENWDTYKTRLAKKLKAAAEAIQ